MVSPVKTSTPQSRYDRYNHSQKGLARHRRYNYSKKGLERYTRYDRRRGSIAPYQRERYHRIQEEAGCHIRVEDFYPGYRLIKALETAEVIEI